MSVAFLVMATTIESKPPIPVRVFAERDRAEAFQGELIDYHLSQPEAPSSDDASIWTAHAAKVDAWRKAHPAGAAASDYKRFGIYEVAA